MLLMADHDLKSLFVVAAQRRRQVLVSHVTRAEALYRAAARSQTAERYEIPLPGLAGAQSLVAAPILLRGRLTARTDQPPESKQDQRPRPPLSDRPAASGGPSPSACAPSRPGNG